MSDTRGAHAVAKIDLTIGTYRAMAETLRGRLSDADRRYYEGFVDGLLAARHLAWPALDGEGRVTTQEGA
jgi:hypothetical protein